MTAVEIANLLKDGGPWGLVALLMVVVVYQHKGWQGCQEQALKDRERLIVTLEAFKDTSERFEKALQSLQATLETRGQVVADLSHQVEIVAEKVQHGFGNLSAALEGFLRLIDRERDRDRDRGRS